ncbi:MAG TPA: CmcI family methyltransferase [Candidatus Hydrogenedentes bacterium]|nr:CmcI family methyltransferase [Candidatus Hydrogenedentota bacterium]
MRPNTRELVRRFTEIFDVPEPVLEIGALQVEGQEGYGDIRPFFRDKAYLAVDMREGPGVDQVENFEQRTSFPDAHFGTIISLDTVEHVYDVFHFMEEVNRVLAPGGLLWLVSVMYYPIHAHPYDYWRFTPETFRRLTAPIGEPLILTQGVPDFPHTIIAVVRKGGRLTDREKEQVQRAVHSMPDTFTGCGWEHPRETALRGEIETLRAYHDQWGKVSVSGFHDFTPEEWRRELSPSAFDPNLSRWYYVSMCWKNARWLGNPIWQIPTDLMTLQELVSEIRPRVIVETGTNRGGSALFFASLLYLLHGGGQVYTMDVTITEETRRRIANSPFRDMIRIFEGSSTDPRIVEQVRSATRTVPGPVMVFLDSDHSYAHVLNETRCYHDLVTPGSYLVVFDTITRYLYDVPHGNKAWFEDNPLRAVQQFLAEHDNFIPDRERERYMATFAPMGFLRKVVPVHPSLWKASQSVLEPTGEGDGIRCVTFEGDKHLWGGLLLGCVRSNQCDGSTLPCRAGQSGMVSLEVRGVANWQGIRLVVNVIDQQHRRLAEQIVDLTDTWQPVSLTVPTRPDSTHAAVQLVKVKTPVPVIFEVRHIRIAL